MADKPHYRKKSERGQSMAEYALIVALVILGFGLALAATGPAIANVFSNTVFNLVSRDRLAPNVTPPSAANFWATMTWVATQTPQEIPLATRTLPPPTVPPTDGPSPTPTPITPTNTPTNTPTITPSPTPNDVILTAPWTDTANSRNIWRLDQFDVGTENWYGQYYPNNKLSGSPTYSGFNSGTAEGKIDFNWGSTLPPVANWTQTDTYSVTWRKGFSVPTGQKTTIQFDIPNLDEGIRIWIMGTWTGVNPAGGSTATSPGTCSNRFNPGSSSTIPATSGTKVTSGGTPVAYTTIANNPSTTNRYSVYDDTFFGYNPASSPNSAIPKECLVVDRWTTGDTSSKLNIRRTLPEGFYVIQIDYLENTGNAAVTVNVTNSSVNENPDNTQITSAGAPIANTNSSALCDWGNVQSTDESDSPDMRWDEYTSAPGLPAGNRCYLELRGAVYVPTVAQVSTMVNPTLTFWDLWDFQAGTNAWVELSNYDSNNDGVTTFTRSLDLNWIKFPLHNNTFNYNWTYQTIPLVGTQGGVPYDFRGKNVAIRFGMENASSTAVNRWWVDTIAVDNVTRKTFTPAKTWNLNDNAQLADFVTSGHWALTTENRIGSTGMAFHESPGRNYSKLSYARNTGTTDQRDFRIHAIEWNGFINISGSLPDEDGDTGDPILTFYEEYDVGKLVGLEIQYTTDPYSAGDGANWQTVPGAGQIVARSKTTATTVTLPEKITVPLKTIGANSFRLRFAMLVNKDADVKGGWWIDEIKLERVDRPRFTNYPFYDPVESPTAINQWQVLGTWDQAAVGYAPAVGETGGSYTDSVSGDYAASQNMTLELKYPIDFRLDTAQNARASNCNLGASLCETGGPFPKPVVPYMTFMWKHSFGSGENFYVEWKRFNDPQSAWTSNAPLWIYADKMATQGTVSRSATRVILDWERVEINLKPIMTAIAVDDTSTQQDDDILIRFRFTSNSSGQSDGVYIDDIRLQEKVEDVWYLWPSTESRTDSSGQLIRNASNAPILGSGTVYSDSLENNPKLFTGGWYYGGGWQAVTYAQRDGLYSFHDSAIGQSEAEPDNSTPIVNTKTSTFNVLEMDKIIDLRGVAATERPVMYFWSRWSISSSNYARVEVSYEDPSLGALCTGGYTQCYEHNLGWSEWEPLWSQTNVQNFTWTRQQVALDRYAKGGSTPGRRIRIRFVLDVLDGTPGRDGWYIDGIIIRHFSERSILINASSTFFDGARDLNNWIPEGKWGLDPEFYRGSGGGPVSLLPSTWAGKFWALIPTSGTDRCAPISGGTDFLTCADKFLKETGTGTTANCTSPTVPAPVNTCRANNTPVSYQQPALLDINYSWGTGGPNSNAFKDNFVGRWVLTTAAVGPTMRPGVYTFIVASDDGVRLKMTTDAGTTPPCAGSDDSPLCNNTWNIINNWTYHGRTVDMGIGKFFPAGVVAGVTPTYTSTGKYTLTMEYFEGTGDAGLSLSVGANTFSFSDTPKQGSGLLFPEVPAVIRGNSSLILNGAFDLRTAVRPILQFYTRYELGGIARVEVTTDGGFTWTSAGLQGVLANTYWQTPDWTGQYWTGGKLLDRLGVGPDRTQSQTGDIDMNWGGNPLLTSPNWNSDNAGVRWRRQINITTPLPLTFRTTADDGVRLWINSTTDPLSPNTNAGCPTAYSTNPYMRSGDIFRGNSTFTTGCLIIDNWQDQGGGVMQVDRTLATGSYWIQLDYYEATGGASVKLEIFPGGYSSPTYSGTYQNATDLSDWQSHQHDLSSYVGQPSVGLRFRLDRLSVTSTQTTTQSPVNWADGLWIVDISMANS